MPPEGGRYPSHANAGNTGGTPEGGTMNFHDKIVLVTGGTGGLGREATMAFLEAGATVVVTYVVAEEFAALVLAAEGTGATPPVGVKLDVTDEQAVGKFV